MEAVIVEGEGAVLGVNLGRSIVTNETLRRSFSQITLSNTYWCHVHLWHYLYNGLMNINKKSQSKLRRAASPPLMAENNYPTKSPLVRMGCPTFTSPPPAKKTASSLRWCPPPSNTPILDRPHSPLQTASRSNQPFCHSTPSGQTDRQTNRQMG